MSATSPRPPTALAKEYEGWAAEVAWSYEERPTVWRLSSPDGGDLFAKVRRRGEPPSVADELVRLRWARDHVDVPDVVGDGGDGEHEWFVMRPVAGLDATVHPWRADPARLVPALARALRAFHDALPAEACPFDSRVSASLDRVRGRAADGKIDPARDFHREFMHLSVDNAIAELERLLPAKEDLVVNHGDFCLPNVMLDDRGGVTGYLDIGELGVRDRRSDVVVAAWSIGWNLGPGWDELFYDSYGVTPDDDSVRFYRLLYDLES